MSLNRNVGLASALRYNGQGPYWTFILHRIGGSALFIFFTLYILSLLGIEPMHSILRNWVFQVVMVVFGIFHAINGLRITILDLMPKLYEHFHTLLYAAWLAYALLAAFALSIVLRSAFGG